MTESTDTPVMLGLGDYRFSIGTAAYQSLRRVATYRWEEVERITRRPAQQYVGEGAGTITLSGVIYPEYRGGLGQLDAMRTTAAAGDPLILVSGLGDVMGLWVVIRVEEGQQYFLREGVPLKQEFTVELRQYGEDQ